ncbi:MAG: hypothetical protein JNK05_27460 [Myxococcales bacterium]|jgi:hypothetical protein|nr:hypothetical protein [Myxococcales bacterium]
MVRGHTYFVARRPREVRASHQDDRGHIEGFAKDNGELYAALEALYQSSRGDAEPTAMDGASVWLDANGAVQLRVIVGGVSRAVDGSGDARWSEWLKGAAA